jgi:thymidylate synthase
MADTKRVILEMHDAETLVHQKICSNNIAIKILETEHRINKNIALFRMKENKVVEKKIELVKQINELFNAQLKKFDEKRHEEVTALYKKIDDLHENESVRKLVEETKNLEDERIDLIKKFAQMESLIPDKQLITNYTIRCKDDPKPCGRSAFSDSAYIDELSDQE